MNKIITLFLLIVIVLGFLNNIIEYFRSKTSMVKRFEHNAFRHFNHIFVPLIFLIISIWTFLKITEEFPLLLNLVIGLLGFIFVFIAIVSFYLYFNYLINNRTDQLVFHSETGILEFDGRAINKNKISQLNWHKVKNKSLIVIWSNFEYMEVIMKDGSRHVISSLLMNLNTLHKFLGTASVNYIYTYFPIIKKSTLL